MSVAVKTRVEFDVKSIARKIETTQDRINKKTAKVGAVMASSLFASKFQGLEPRKHVEHVISSFKAQRSIKKDHGWIFGPFASGSGKWEETVGGRSFFYEYGRMPPGKGRASVGRANYVNIDSEGQPPRPFMRPTKNVLRPKHRYEMEKEFGRVTKQMNKKYK